MFNDCIYKRTFKSDKKEVEFLHSKKQLNFKEIDFMLKYYKKL